MSIIPSDSVAPAPAPGPSRRALIGGAAWSVPAIVVVTTAPAYAAGSELGTLGVTTPSMQVVAAGTTVVTAVLRDSANRPLAGKAVTFTGPAGTSFSPATAITDAAGTATSTLTTTDRWATPGSILLLTATSGGATGTTTSLVLGANAYSVGSNPSGTLGTGSSADPVAATAQLSLVFPSPIRSIAAGEAFTLALLADGSVWSIGTNDYGQLGLGDTTSRSTWTRIPDLGVALQIAAGPQSGYALLTSGTIRSWGRNSDGQLGNGSAGSARLTPVSVSSITDAVDISAGRVNAYAIVADGTVRSWGNNFYGQLGNGTTGSRSASPVSVSGLSGVTQIAAASDTTYALSNGAVSSWGYGGEGQLGVALPGGSLGQSTPTAIPGLSNTTQIAAGYGSGYALIGGQVRAWGQGSSGQLGNGQPFDSSSPVTVSTLAGVTRIAAGRASAYAISETGVSAWGRNQSGQLGDGSTTDRRAPVAVQGVANVTALVNDSSASQSAFFLRTGSDTLSVTTPDMQVTAAGTTAVTALLRDSANQPLFGRTVTFTGPAGSSFSPATATTNGSGIATTTLTTTDTWATPGSSLLLTATSTGVTGTATLTVLGANAYAVGANDNSALGTGSSAATISPPAQLSLVFTSRVKSVTGTNTFSLALLEDGTVWGIGDNSVGQLGDGTTTNRTTWTKIPSLSGVTQIAATASRSGHALLSDGQVRAWGSNVNGELGNGSLTNSSTPVAVSNLTGATQIAAGSASAYAIVAGGQVRAWGLNAQGQLGNGTTTNSPTPVTVQNITGATQIAAGVYSGFALVSGGTIRAWGSNTVGTLGNGTNTSSTIPVTVQNITGATQLVAGGSTAYAVVGGQVRAWGYNANGELGNGTNTNSNTPVTVSPLTGITQIDASYFTAYAINNTGTVYAWGNNPHGNLGNGNTTSSNTPVTVQNLGGTLTIGGARPRASKMFFFR